MMVDTTVYGYVGEGYVQCPTCHDERPDDDNMGRLYSTDDNSSEGLSCDACGKYIFEPDYRGQWQEALQDLLTYGRAHSDGDWRTAERILLMFEDAGFEPEGKSPDR